MADFWFTESVRVRDGVAASLLGAKVFQAPLLTTSATSRARLTPPHSQLSPKSFAILEAG